MLRGLSRNLKAVFSRLHCGLAPRLSTINFDTEIGTNTSIMENLKAVYKFIATVALSILVFLCNFGCKDTDKKDDAGVTDKINTQKGGIKGSAEKTLLAIFAHPDDELTVGPILAKYVDEGTKVYLVIATDGRYGTNEHSDFESGDGLAIIRRAEMQCSASHLGVELLHLEYHDQLKSGEGYDGHMPHIRSLLKEVHGIVDNIQPDAIITFGPDGWSNHMDHRLVGATVTQIVLSKLWTKPINLYYVGTPSDLLDDPENRMLRGQDRSYLTTKVTYTEEQMERAYKALACHKSQFDEDGLERMKTRDTNKEKAVYLRKFAHSEQPKNSVFE